MNALIRHHQLENGIYEIIFLAKTRASVDEFFQTVQLVYDSSPNKQLLRLLIDLSMPGVIPMQYMFQQGQTWRRHNTQKFSLRATILYPERGILPIARVLVNATLQARGTQTKLRLESIINREAAIQWLLGDKS